MKAHRQLEHANRTRTGLSIAEVVIASSMLTVLTVTGITTVCLLMTAEQRSAESVVVERTITALADELRRDAHAASIANVEQDTTLSLQAADGLIVTYECTDDGVWRREQRGDETGRREKFHLPFGTSRFEPIEDGRLIVWRHEREIPVTASLSEPAATTEQPRRTYRIEAALDWRTDHGGEPAQTAFLPSD